MKTANHDKTRFELGTDQMLTIPRRPRVNITCTAGELWITERPDATGCAPCKGGAQLPRR